MINYQKIKNKINFKFAVVVGIIIFVLIILSVYKLFLKKNDMAYTATPEPTTSTNVATNIPTPIETPIFTQVVQNIKNTIVKPAAPVVTDVTSNMRLTFDEEFNGRFSRYVDKDGNITCKKDGSGTWQTVYNFCSRTQPANHELEVYTDPGFFAYLKKETQADSEKDPDNPLSVSKGILSIKAAPSSAQVLSAVGPWAKFTSGLITTQFSFTQTYGYFEMRAKLPKGKGLWPAFWLLPADETWPPEVDAMEAFGATGETGEGGATQVHYATHMVNNATSCGGWHDLGVDLSQDFHTYGVDIEKDTVTYYFDRKVYMKCISTAELNKPFYMLINLAVGGWPGSPDSNATWPAYMYVDYVRAYQTKN